MTDPTSGSTQRERCRGKSWHTRRGTGGWGQASTSKLGKCPALDLEQGGSGLTQLPQANPGGLCMHSISLSTQAW